MRSRSANSITSSEVVALARHATLDVADPAPGVQPRAERAEHGQIGFDAGRFQRDEAQAAEAVGHGWRARALAVLEQLLAMPREFTAVTAT